MPAGEVAMARVALIVEDNALNHQLLSDLMSLHGYIVQSASCVEDAQAILAGVRPDIVLMDIDIPGGGGESVLRSIRNNPAIAKVPVVAVTGFAMQGDRERLLAAGFDDYISKPIDVRTFVSRVESLVHGSRP
jgi:CheY-like chemotaxis protein